MALAPGTTGEEFRCLPLPSYEIRLDGTCLCVGGCCCLDRTAPMKEEPLCAATLTPGPRAAQPQRHAGSWFGNLREMSPSMLGTLRENAEQVAELGASAAQVAGCAVIAAGLMLNEQQDGKWSEPCPQKKSEPCPQKKQVSSGTGGRGAGGRRRRGRGHVAAYANGAAQPGSGWGAQPGSGWGSAWQ
mmetsp:Transcript_34354/g.102051  ORF Transcript_34354/g.102051 Transcript_34354/m.102051 type:complete len:187 (+) Transcript_34354:91-651(+)